LSAYASVIEENSGLNTSVRYYFVIDGNKLVHISKYAVSSREVLDNLIEYLVNLNKLRGKTIVEVVGSKASGLHDYLYVFPAEYLGNHYETASRLPFSYLNGFEFTYLTQEAREFLLSDWRQYYIPMLAKINMFFNSLRKPYIFIYLQHLLSLQLNSDANYPLPSLVPYSNSRRKTLNELIKQIHQIWLILRIIMELSKKNNIKDFIKSLPLDYYIVSFKQGSSHPVAAFNCSCGVCSIWHEFDLNPYSRFEGVSWREKESPNSIKEFEERASKIPKSIKRNSLRPDIVVLCDVNSYEDFYKVDKVRVRALIECKNRDIQYWRKDINTQIIPYKQIFQPDITVVASLKKVPESIKAQLNQ